MSWTFSPEGIKLQRLLNNENWDILFTLLNQFCYHRGWSLSSKNSRYNELHYILSERFLADKALMKGSFTFDFWQEYFIDFLKEQEILLTEIDLKKIEKTIKRICER